MLPGPTDPAREGRAVCVATPEDDDMSAAPIGSTIPFPSQAFYRDATVAPAAAPSDRPIADVARAERSTAGQAGFLGRDLGLGAPDNLLAQALWRCTATLTDPRGGVPLEVSASHSMPSVAKDTVREAAGRLQGLFPNHQCAVGNPVRIAD
jgi:hypothetical protein